MLRPFPHSVGFREIRLGDRLRPRSFFWFRHAKPHNPALRSELQLPDYVVVAG